jgi:ribonucleoside-triphosphate reductase
VYDNWDDITGVSFLPYTDHKYPLAPYEEITKEEYETILSSFPSLDFSLLAEYEKETGDTTKASHELACKGGACELGS